MQNQITRKVNNGEDLLDYEDEFVRKKVNTALKDWAKAVRYRQKVCYRLACLNDQEKKAVENYCFDQWDFTKKWTESELKQKIAFEKRLRKNIDIQLALIDRERSELASEGIIRERPSPEPLKYSKKLSSDDN